MTTSQSQLVKGQDELTTQLIRRIYPDIEREISNIGRSFVDVGIWLVGLSTGVLALLISSENTSNLIGEWSFTWGVIAFSSVVFLGVMQRVIFHIAELMRLPISIRFRTALIAATDNSRMAVELDDNWTVEDIVKQLKEDFGVDYSYLIEYGSSIGEAKKAYNSQLDIHREFEERGLTSLANLVCVHTGLKKEKEESFFQTGADDEKTRSAAILANRVYRLADIVYFSSAVVFAVGIGILAVGAT
jgi:hypothetical protein